MYKGTCWRRRRWKYCAAVLGCTTSQLTLSPSALVSLLSLSCRKRSMRQLLCSGPAPSIPCGSSSTSPHCRPHLLSPLLTKVSRMIWAPLKKSPNCASQMMRLSGCSTAMPYSKASTASSERILLAISSLPPAPPCMLLKGMKISLVSWSTSMACRWEKVARPTSWPLIRTL